MLSTVKHYARRLLLMVYGPAQLDEQHDPVIIEDRRYEEERQRHSRDKRTG